MSDTPVLVVPRTHTVRVRAPWIALANWASAIEAVIGPPQVLNTNGVVSPLDVARSMRAGRSNAERAPVIRSIRKFAAGIVADGRAAARMLRVRADSDRLESHISDSPAFVLQYHTLFERVGLITARRRSVPFVLLVDAPIVWEGRQWGRRRSLTGWLIERLGEAWQAKRADLVLCVSDDARERIISWGVRPDRLRVIGNPIDVERFDVDREAHDHVMIGWVGGFLAFHRLELLVEAIGLAQREVPNLHVTFIGDGPDQGRIGRLVTDAGLPNVAFLGAVDPGDMPNALSRLDIGVISAGDGEFHYSPMKMREYCAAGLAVVAPRTGEPGRLLTHRSNAMLYRSGDVADMATQLIALATDEELRNRVASGGRELARREFSLHGIGSAVVNWIAEPDAEVT